MRNKVLLKNTISSLLLQITTIICGFILPRCFLKGYGSDTNGIVNSITQFLSFISFLELGIGRVVQSALYKPLADQNEIKISEILTSATIFFHRLSYVFLTYIVFLIFMFPQMAKQSVEWTFSATLIAAMSISSFAQYYFGIVDRLLLTADQKGYIHYTAQMVSLILNTIISVIFINKGASIHVIKLITSLIYLVRPIVLRMYVNRHYCINRRIQYQSEPISQKWNGIAQHITAVVFDGTDVIVLTIFSTFSNVSVYSIYHLVVTGIRQLVVSLSEGIHVAIGELWAKQQIEELHKTFCVFEWAVHTSTTFIFGCASCLILPFVQVYTHSVDDANYLQPLFSILIVVAHAWFCFRLPYHTMILVAGHFKQTQSNYIIAALINIVISILTVKVYGLVGVAIGTLTAMIYQTIWMAYYNSHLVLHWHFYTFLRQLIADGLVVLIAFPTCQKFVCSIDTFTQWVFLAIPISITWLISTFVVNMILYKNEALKLMKHFNHLLHKN